MSGDVGGLIGGPVGGDVGAGRNPLARTEGSNITTSNHGTRNGHQNIGRNGERVSDAESSREAWSERPPGLSHQGCVRA
jgi:hypothetical protein